MVVGAAPTRWTTVGMKLEDLMQGSRSEAMDERGQSLVMDGGVEGMVQQRTSGRAAHSSRKQHAVGEAEGAAGRRWP